MLPDIVGAVARRGGTEGVECLVGVLTNLGRPTKLSRPMVQSLLETLQRRGCEVHWANLTACDFRCYGLGDQRVLIFRQTTRFQLGRASHASPAAERT